MRTIFAVLLISFCASSAFAAVGIPDPANSTVEPWDIFGHAYMNPGGASEVVITVVDNYGVPIPSTDVWIDVSGCTQLCIDVPDGMMGMTDGSGQVTLNPAAGGCEDCIVTVVAGGVPIRDYPSVKSADWDGVRADGIVDDNDLDFLNAHFEPGYDVCADYNADGFVDVADYTMLMTVFGAMNNEPCLEGGTPDPSLCVVDPWDGFGHAFMNPGGASDVTIIVLDAFSDPVPGVPVTIDVSGCTQLCVDVPDGMSGTTDVNGEVILYPAAGGCEACDVNIYADGVLIRTYTEVRSCDWDGSYANGIVGSEDQGFFGAHYPSPPFPYEPCADYNGDLVVDIGDYNMIGLVFGAANNQPCILDSCEVVPTHIDCGIWDIDSFFDVQFVIRNVGENPLVGDVTESCADFSIISGGGPYVIPGGDSLEVVVRFQPTTPGVHSCWIETGGGLCSDVLCTGEGAAPPTCLIYPTSIWMDTVYVGSWQDTVIIVKNGGGGTLIGWLEELLSPDFHFPGDTTFTLAAGDSALIWPRFEPTEPGSLGCVIKSSGDICSDVTIWGWGEMPPICSVWPDTVDFGAVDLYGILDTAFVITNLGGGYVTGTVSETCGDYSILSGAGSYSLQGGETLTVVVRFSPTLTGPSECLVDLDNPDCPGVVLRGTGTLAPRILSITDVGNDQGRWARILWRRCVDDGPVGYDITGYAIYRRQDLYLRVAETAMRVTPRAGAPQRASALVGWDYLDTVPARGDSLYQTVVPTLCDSTIGQGQCWSVFFISALTPDPLTYFDSAPDSGYSLDNLAPAAPQNFAVAYNQGTGNELTWTEAEETDFNCYRIYRSSDPNFVPSLATRVHTTIECVWVDAEYSGWNMYYKITCEDFAGNESDPSSATIIVGIDEPEAPGTFVLHQNIPNPFNPSTIIRYDVPASGGRVTLRIYDVSGRLVRTLVDGDQSVGWKDVEWDGKDNEGRQVGTGVYFYRMTAPGYTKTRKMVLLR